MSNDIYGNISKYISFLLRHKPEAGNLKLDVEGWCDVEELMKALNKKFKGVTFNDLNKIVITDNKGRYSFNDDSTKIRANQGHSINVDLKLESIKPPKELYHGTSKNNFEKIKMVGSIKKMARQYVHLSDNLETASNVGKRHGELIILRIDSEKMFNDGFKFYLSQNGVWLTDNVPAKYFNQII